MNDDLEAKPAVGDVETAEFGKQAGANDEFPDFLIERLLNRVQSEDDPFVIKTILPVLDDKNLSQEQFQLVFNLLNKYASEADVLVNALGVLDSDLFLLNNEQSDKIFSLLGHSDSDVSYNATRLLLNLLEQQMDKGFLSKFYEAMKPVVENRHDDTILLFLDSLIKLKHSAYHYDSDLYELIEAAYNRDSKINALNCLLMNDLGNPNAKALYLSDEQSDRIMSILSHLDPYLRLYATSLLVKHVPEKNNVSYLSKLYEAMKAVVENGHNETVSLFLYSLARRSAVSFYDSEFYDLIKQKYQQNQVFLNLNEWLLVKSA